MTVGVPEINLDTWGLRYVKKKQPHEVTEGEMGKIGYSKPISETAGQAPSNAESKISGSKTPSTKPTESTTAGNRASDADLDTPDAFRGRQEDSKGDKDVKVHNATDKPSTSPQVHEAPKNVEPKQGEQGKGKYGVGSIIPAGSTQGDQKTPKLTTGKHGKQPDPKHPEKRDQQNPTRGVTERKNPEFASGKDTPADANLLSTETRSQMRGTKKDPKTGEEKRHGKRLDRYGSPSKGSKEGKQPKGTGKPLQTQTSPEHKNPVPTGSGAPKIKAEMELAIIKCKLLKMNDISKRGEWDHLPHAQKEKEEEEKVEKGTKDYGSDNTGSAQIVDTGDGKPTASKQSVEISTSPSKYREDEEVTSYGTGNSGDPKTSTGEPSMTEGKTTHGKDSDKKLTHGGKIAQRSRREGEQPENRTATKSDEIVEKAIELINEAYDEMKSTDFRKLKPTYEGDTKEAKKDAPASTGDVGAANFVYSDVHEKKKVRSQAQADADKKEAEANSKDDTPKTEKPKKKKEDWEKRGEYMSPEQLYADRDTFY